MAASETHNYFLVFFPAQFAHQFDRQSQADAGARDSG